MNSTELRTLISDYRNAISAARDESLPEDARAKAADDVADLRIKIDETHADELATREDDERIAAAEAREFAAQKAAKVASPEPTMRDRYLEWVKNGKPGTFSIVAMPDYRALADKTGSRVEMWLADREAVIEGQRWYQTPGLETRADVINETANQGAAYLWPTDTLHDVVWHENAISGVMQAGPTILQTPDDRPLIIPTFATDSSATLTAEGTESTESAPVFAHMHLDAYRIDGHFHVGNETLRSSAVPLEAVLANAASRAIATAVSGYLSAGTGSSQPQGLSAHATTTTTAGKETASKDTVCMDDFIGLKLSVLPAARAVGKFVAGSTTYVQLPTLKSGAGEYLWEPSLQAGTPDRLLGAPIFEDGGYDAIGTDNHVIATFGDMSAYWVRQAGPVVIEASEAPTWTSFETTWRFAKWMDAELMDVAAIKHLYCHA